MNWDDLLTFAVPEMTAPRGLAFRRVIVADASGQLYNTPDARPSGLVTRVGPGDSRAIRAGDGWMRLPSIRAKPGYLVVLVTEAYFSFLPPKLRLSMNFFTSDNLRVAYDDVELITRWTTEATQYLYTEAEARIGNVACGRIESGLGDPLLGDAEELILNARYGCTPGTSMREALLLLQIVLYKHSKETGRLENVTAAYMSDFNKSEAETHNEVTKREVILMRQSREHRHGLSEPVNRGGPSQPYKGIFKKKPMYCYDSAGA